MAANVWINFVKAWAKRGMREIKRIVALSTAEARKNRP